MAAMMVTMIVAAFGIYWVFDTDTDQNRYYRGQILAGGAAAGLAIVTFCTVVWRGLISARQADTQQRQIEKLSEQIASSTESSLADLLQRGAELVAETNKPAHVAAGIAILQSVALNDRGAFATEAMDLLADFATLEFNSRNATVPYASAVQALALGAQRGRISGRAVTLTLDEESYWDMPLKGVRRVTYRGGIVRKRFLERSVSSTTARQFNSTHFENCRHNVDGSFMNCTFYSCHILGISGSWFSVNMFHNCDFSGASIEDADEFPDLKLENGNWFDPMNPPTCADGSIEWEQFLTRGRPADDGIPF